MSRRRDLEAKLRNLGEIRDILSAMKNMARIEVHRLGRFLETQRKVVASIEAAAADFRAFHPELFVAENAREVFLLLGSERGFCGDFNESLLRAFEAHSGRTADAGVVAAGSKLRSKAGDSLPQAVFLESASVADEIEAMLVQVMDAVSRVHGPASAASLRLTVFHHHEHGQGARVSVLYPFEASELPPRRFPYPPDLLLDPASFARELTEQYLFARLHELLYSSLLTENQARVEHLESAVQRLERKSAELFRTRNVLRQEEITEEIEVIMLSAEMMR
jgi:F-type H+-transporting ATPase subunit gamma